MVLSYAALGVFTIAIFIVGFRSGCDDARSPVACPDSPMNADSLGGAPAAAWQGALLARACWSTAVTRRGARPQLLCPIAFARVLALAHERGELLEDLLALVRGGFALH